MLNDKLYSIWENIPADDKMFFLINESAILISELRKAGDKTGLEDFRKRLKADLSFADVELQELELRSRIKALCGTDIDEAAADELTALAKEIHALLDFEAETLSA